MAALLSDGEVIDRVLSHIDNKTTDLGDDTWREPIDHYSSMERFAKERALFRRMPLVFCPAAALPGAGSYVARDAAGTPIVAVRGEDGVVRAFRNACRHRGMKVAEGAGCAKAFVCGYHGWMYHLDGRLRHIPKEIGFAGLDWQQYGLVPVTATERHGLIFVTQEEPVTDGPLINCPDLIGPEQVLIDPVEFEFDVNWKLFAEAGMEGYHIKMTHRDSFYRYGFDNLNVVETFGPSSRVTFPFKRIEQLRDVPPDERRIDGKLTFAYHLFPNVLIAQLSRHTAVQIAEPISPTRTRYIRYRLTARGTDGSEATKADGRRDAEFVKDTGNIEDRDVTIKIQDGLPSGANSHFTYGRFEKAIVHFHKTMAGMLDKLLPD